MGISTVQIVLLVVFGCIAGMGSVLDSFQTHRPLIACTVVGLILGDVKTGILLWRYTGNDRSWMDEHRSSTVS